MAGEKDLCSEHSGCTVSIKNLVESDKRQWVKLNEHDGLFRKYVPIWVTVVLTVMGGVTGSALTFAGMIIKFKG